MAAKRSRWLSNSRLPQQATPTVKAKPEPAPAPPPKFDLLAKRREIAALRVRGKFIPKALREWDHLSLGRICKAIRREMDEAGAPDSEVEAFVEKHVRAV